MEHPSNTTTQPTNYGAVTSLSTVFFFWGFIAAGNGIFIPFCKSYFDLDQFNSQLIDWAFYFAYYLGALSLFGMSTQKGRDIVGTWGYKKSIVYGLIFSTIGAVFMIIGVRMNNYVGMLVGLFIVALGFSLQQTSANPFMISLGDEKTGSSRINLGGGINSFGTAIGPLIVSLALFGSAKAVSPEQIKNLDLGQVVLLYTCVGALFLAIALMFHFSKKVPAGYHKEEIRKANSALGTLIAITGVLFICYIPVFSSYNSDAAMQLVELDHAIDQLKVDEDGETILSLNSAQETTLANLEASREAIAKPLEQKRMAWLIGGLLSILVGIGFASYKGRKGGESWGAMKYPQLTLGMLAIFFYVGVEVALSSNFGELLKQPAFGSKDESNIAPYISMFWGSLMIGRWTGAINAFELKKQTKNLLRFVVPLVAFGVVLGVGRISGYDMSELYWFILCVLIQIGAFFVTNDRPAITLGLFGALGLLSTIIAISSSGMIAIYGVLSAGLCCSIMWPCIFSLSLAGLGKFQAQGSAFLVMMILGGAIVPPIQGKLADLIGIQNSYWVSVACFVYLVFFAVSVKGILKKQNVDFAA